MIELPLTTPGAGSVAMLGQLWSLIWSELLMQWRRWGLWLAFATAMTIIMMIFVPRSSELHFTGTFQGVPMTVTEFVNLFVFTVTRYGDTLLAIIAALLVSDRLIRDKNLGMDELQQATSLPYWLYAPGKFTGNFVAIILPTFAVYMLCGIGLVAMGMPLFTLQSLMLAFVLVFLPAFAAVIALVLLLSSLVPLRIVQIGFPLLWLYSTLSPLGWKTIATTIFNPAGSYIFPVFFPALFDKVHPGASDPQLALYNILALLATASVSLILLTLSLGIQAQKKSR